MGRYVAVGGIGRGRRPPVRPALPQPDEAWASAGRDAGVCSRLRTDVTVMYACGISEVQVDRSQAHCVLSDVLAHFRHRLDELLMEALLAIQAPTAMEAGLVSPAHVVVDTFPREQGSPTRP